MADQDPGRTFLFTRDEQHGVMGWAGFLEGKLPPDDGEPLRLVPESDLQALQARLDEAVKEAYARGNRHGRNFQQARLDAVEEDD